MGTVQNPSPNLYPSRNPNPNLTPTPVSKYPSFDEVSKLFSLPLSDAAESLGVCPSVLKKVCYDNGLIRWPYRKFLSGKSIEDIKKDAAVDKVKQVSGERNGSLTSSAVSSSPGPQHQIPLQESLNSRIPVVQQPTKENLSANPQNLHSSTISRGSLVSIDEFKYGFPSAGLSSVSFRWWGDKSDGENGIQHIGGKDEEERKQLCKDSVDTTTTTNDDEEATEDKKTKIDADTLSTNLLTGLRKRAAGEGRQALKLGINRGYNGKTLDRAKKTVLMQIFKSSLPDEWVEDIIPES